MEGTSSLGGVFTRLSGRVERSRTVTWRVSVIAELDGVTEVCYSSVKMTTIGKGADLMEVLKKKMRQAKEDTERLKDENEEISRKLQIEIQRREAVSVGSGGILLCFIRFSVQ